MKTVATKSADGSYYTLSGSKMWITNSAEAGIFLVFANLDPSKGYKGISCFLVEREMGVEVMAREKKLGIKASSTCTVNFDDIKVPAANLIGEEGKGYKYAIEILNEGRIGIAAQMVGIAQGAFDLAVPYTFQRKQFGQAVGTVRLDTLELGLTRRSSRECSSTSRRCRSRLKPRDYSRTTHPGSRRRASRSRCRPQWRSCTLPRSPRRHLELRSSGPVESDSPCVTTCVYDTPDLFPAHDRNREVLARLEDWSHLRGNVQHPASNDRYVAAFPSTSER